MMSLSPRLWVYFTVTVLAIAALAGCEDRGHMEEVTPTPTPVPMTEEEFLEMKHRQVALLMQLMVRQPDKFTYERAYLTEQNEVALVLNSDMNMDRLPDLMKAIMSVMVREFKVRIFTVVLYQAAGAAEPRKIGIVQADAGRRTLTHLPESSSSTVPPIR